MRLTPKGSEPGKDYLIDLSPKDKPWDTHKRQADQVSQLYQGTIFDRLAGRIHACSGYLEFCWAQDPKTGEYRLKLKKCRFCRVRHCPLCQWRRSLMWVARFLNVLPALSKDYPTARYLFLTLTVRNCPLEELRATLNHLNASWKRMAHRKDFPAIGFARATEITKGKDGTAHPHFHVLMMVKQTYFKGTNYLSQADWAELWRGCLQVEYTPVVDVRAVKPNRKHGAEALPVAIVETFKYSVKPEDMLGGGTEQDRSWLVELTKQLQKTRAIALGGVLRHYLSEGDPEDLLTETGADDLLEDAGRLYFGWREVLQHYVKLWED